MKVDVFADDDALTTAAADLVHLSITEFAGRALGIATGATPLGLYAELGRRAASGALDTAGLALVALDEYLGLGPSDEASFAAYVHSQVAAPLAIPSERVAVLDGMGDAQQECAAFERRIAEWGGVGVQIVGIGSNGHLAFNEPGTPFDSRTHVVRLSEQTRQDNRSSFMASAVPQFALTQGIATIMEAQRILLLARGASKAEAVARALTGAPDPSCPASVLQLHPDVVVLLDSAAAGALELPISA